MVMQLSLLVLQHHLHHASISALLLLIGKISCSSSLHFISWQSIPAVSEMFPTWPVLARWKITMFGSHSGVLSWQWFAMTFYKCIPFQQSVLMGSEDTVWVLPGRSVSNPDIEVVAILRCLHIFIQHCLKEEIVLEQTFCIHWLTTGSATTQSGHQLSLLLSCN